MRLRGLYSCLHLKINSTRELEWGIDILISCPRWFYFVRPIPPKAERQQPKTSVVLGNEKRKLCNWPLERMLWGAAQVIPSPTPPGPRRSFSECPFQDRWLLEAPFTPDSFLGIASTQGSCPIQGCIPPHGWSISNLCAGKKAWSPCFSLEHLWRAIPASALCMGSAEPLV